MPSAPISPTKALETLKTLNTLLYLRLTLHEIIPVPLQNYTISNGEVTFTVPGEWQLSLTISDEFGQWWFVDFKYLQGQEVGEIMKRRVQQFLEEAFQRCKIEYGLFPMGVTEEGLRTMNKKAPLVEAYNFLRMSLIYFVNLDRFHLVYSLSSLHHSLHRLSLTARFSPYIQVVSSQNRDVVEFQYWIRAPATRSQTPRSHPVRLSIVNEEVNLSVEEAVCGIPGDRMALDYARLKVGVRWMRDGIEVDSPELEGLDLSNAEKLVEYVTKVHARMIMEKISSETEGVTFWDNNELFFKLIDSSRRIRISVDLLTGRILLTEASTTSAILLPPILQQAQHNLTSSILPTPQAGSNQPARRPLTAKESISSARLASLKSHISTLAEYKGWTSLRYGYGYIHKYDLDTFLPQGWTWDELLFLSLGKEVIIVHCLTKQGWLVDLRALVDGTSVRVVWVEKIANVKFSDYSADWLDWLDGIRFFVRGRYAVYEIQQGLETRGVEFSVIPPPSAAESTLAHQLRLPLLSLKSKNLIPENLSCWASDNLIVRVVREMDQLNVVWEGKVRQSAEVEQLLSSVTNADPLSFNATKKIFSLKFPLSEESTPDIIVGSLIKRFLSIERILQLVRQTKAVQARYSQENIFRLERFTLSGVECVYGIDGPGGELWPLQILVGSPCDILFRHDDPHERFKAFITGWYNASGGDIDGFVEVTILI